MTNFMSMTIKVAVLIDMPLFQLLVIQKNAKSARLPITNPIQQATCERRINLHCTTSRLSRSLSRIPVYYSLMHTTPCTCSRHMKKTF